MRFDPKSRSTELNLTKRQRLFAEVWFNQVHEYSQDAFRVRTMNPVSIVGELVKCFSIELFNSSDRGRIVAEALDLLSHSVLIQHPRFKAVADELMLVLQQWKNNNKNAEKAKEGSSDTQSLIETFSRELQAALEAEYVNVCIAWLFAELNVPAPPIPDRKLADIEQITGQLLSCLVSTGWSFESLFHLYRTACSSDPQHTAAGAPYQFDHALAWLFNRLARPGKSYRITFTVTQFANIDEIPPRVGDIEFSKSPPTVLPGSAVSVKRLATTGPNKLFASMTVPAKDSRIAGMRAAEHIEQVLDVVRYDFVRQNFSINDRFLVEKDDGRHIVLQVSKTVPNERREVTSAQLQEFMKQLNNLVASGTLEADAKDRIYSAFRLYRIGAESANLENKLVNWWTALEFLVKAGGGNIGDAVEKALFPTVTLFYLTKHLNALKAALLEFKAPLSHTDGAIVDLLNTRAPDLYRYCQDKTFRDHALQAAADHPFAELYLQSLFAKLEKSETVLKAMDKHEQAVRWQIQRIYRARCNIVHSASRINQAALLCANLESYLKILLDTFLKSFQSINTLRTPREFFDRQRYALDRVKQQLRANDDLLLIEILRRQEATTQ